jgi:hypothetical protein
MSTIFGYPSIQELSIDPNLREADLKVPSRDAWAVFLSAYSKGDWTSIDQCPVELLEAADDEVSADSFKGSTGHFDDHHIYPSVDITSDVARNVRKFVLSQDYLPPPRSPYEHLRKSCILEYDILGRSQKSNIQNAADVIAAFFPGDVITTFTLFDGNYQTLAAVGGNKALLEKYALTLDKPIAVQQSLRSFGTPG